MDGGWNEANCSIALNLFLAGHKLSTHLKYKKERNQDRYFHFKTVCCVSLNLDPDCKQIGSMHGKVCFGDKSNFVGNSIATSICRGVAIVATSYH